MPEGTKRPPINWEKLARANTHPIQVRILEAIHSTGAPVSAKALEETGEFEGVAYYAQLAYHLKQLARAELVELVEQVQRRGATEKYYRPAEESHNA